MISKTIGFRGTLFSDTPIYVDGDLPVLPLKDAGFFHRLCSQGAGDGRGLLARGSPTIFAWDFP